MREERLIDSIKNHAHKWLELYGKLLINIASNKLQAVKLSIEVGAIYRFL